MKDGSRIGDWEKNSGRAKEILGVIDKQFRDILPTIGSRAIWKDHRTFERTILQPKMLKATDIRRKQYERLVSRITSYGKTAMSPDELVKSLRSREIYD